MNTPLSIYIHWPFCLSKCPYCDFNSHISANVDHSLWLKSYEKELEYFSDIISGNYIKSIFFGGGTPSLMSPFVVAGVINKISKLAKIDDTTEVTLEANPTSSEAEKFENFKLAGVNRISVGVQSLKDRDLKSLGRQHDAGSALKTIEIAKNIFSKMSFDLIYARSGQILKDWQEELQSAIKVASSHISLYQLTIEKGTNFYKLFKAGSLSIPDSDAAAIMYEWTNSYLESLGYLRYEISNYAKPNHECKHNLAYWNYDNYLGIGPGAHSRITSGSQTTSIMMWHKPEKWLNSVSTLGNGMQSKNILSKEEVAGEVLMMGLRLKSGINIKTAEQKIDQTLNSILDLKMVEYYQTLGLIELNKNICLTDKGLMLHSYLVPRLLKNTIQ